MTNILFAIGGQQSNDQGAAKLPGGVVVQKATSAYLSQTDPFSGCNNTGQGGSMLPYLIDMGRLRGVTYTCLNYAIGGASISNFLGITGSTVTGGSAATPAAVGYMGAIGLSGGSGLPAPGDPDFDPFTFMSRTRAGIVAAVPANFDKVVVSYCMGESDAGNGAAFITARLQAYTNYILQDGNVSAVFLGLTSKQASATTGQFDILQQGVRDAVAALIAAGKPVFGGPDLYAWYGSNPPLYPEENTTTKVHLILRGQYNKAALMNNCLGAAGY